MRALVTGGAGFIGSHLVNRLLELGHDVVVIDNEKSFAVSEPCWNDNAENYNAEVCDFGDTRSLYDGVDYVFHLAADITTMSTINNPIKSNFINSFGTNVVLQCSREATVKRVIYVSTASVYGNNEIPNKEIDGIDCLTPYSMSKFHGEQLCKLYYDLFKLETVILRPYTVYGEGQHVRGQYSSVINLFETQKLKNQPLTIVGNGEDKKDFIHVSDVVEACILAATAYLPEKHIASAFNIGFGKNYSVNEIAKFYNHSTINIPKENQKNKNTLANIEKSQSLLKWTPKVKLEKWLGERNV